MFWAILSHLSFQGLSVRSWCYSGHLSGWALPVKGVPFEEDLFFEICTFLFSSPQLGPLEGTPEQKNFCEQIIFPLLAPMGVRRKKCSRQGLLTYSSCPVVLTVSVPDLWILIPFPLLKLNHPLPNSFLRETFVGPWESGQVSSLLEMLWLLRLKEYPSFMHP